MPHEAGISMKTLVTNIGFSGNKSVTIICQALPMKLNHPELIPVRMAISLLPLVLATTLATGAEAPSVSEVFEKAIYSEQTKGDLDGAMQLYQQVVAQAKAGQAIAAQAQYHLGACYYKKKDY